MKIINLHDTDAIKSFIFPGGEISIELKDRNTDDEPGLPSYFGNETTLFCPIRSSNDWIKMLMVIDALVRAGGRKFELEVYIPYFPYSRAERIFIENKQPNALQTIIRTLAYLKDLPVIIATFDPHSSDCENILETYLGTQKVYIDSNERFIEKILQMGVIDTIVFPDAGAQKKAKGLMEHLTKVGFNLSYAVAYKDRDIQTGEIKSIKLDGDVSGKHCLVVDDICDGGGTFNLLSNELRKGGVQSMQLAVSHGIFSKGTEELLENYYRIFTTDSFYADNITGVLTYSLINQEFK